MGALTALPALDIKTPQQPDLLEKFSQLQALRNAQQEYQQRAAMAPLQQQEAQQSIQSGQLGIQQQQQALKDDQTFRAAMQDPSMHGKTIGEVADVLAQKGQLSQAGWANAKKLDTEQKTAFATLDEKTLANQKAAHDATQQLYNNVMNMPDEQLAANWPQIAQQYDSIPGNNKQPLDPSKPLTKQQLAQFAPAISMANAYFDQELARRKAQTEQQTAEAELAKKQQDVQFGPTGVAADAKYSFLQKKLAAKQPITPDDQAWMKGYEKQKLLVPATTANIRVEGYSQSRELPVIDTKNGNALIYANAADINAANKSTPGRFVPAAQGSKDLSKTAVIEDIRGNINSVRQSLSNPKMPEFSAAQRAEIAVALGGNDPSTGLQAAFRGGVLGSLTPEQQDYLISMAQLKENAMAMRSVLGAGQGSEDLRQAITNTIPGPKTPSKMYAGKQLDAFESVLNRLERGIPKVPLAGSNPKPASPQNDPLGIR